MIKIPTLFVRDELDRRYVTPQLTPGCGWVLEGLGVATRKYDGTCMMFDGKNWWARREVKPGKHPPPNYHLIEVDFVTGARIGWEPVEQSSYAKYHAEALNNSMGWEAGTFELIGPKINGNPEDVPQHLLVRHGQYRVEIPDRSYEALRIAVTMYPYEGFVFHHPDGRMAKIKRRDFRAP